MNFFCKHFGHKIPTGYAGGIPYGDTMYFGTDGLGVEHYQVCLKCTRCGKGFPVVNFHVPKEGLK